MKIFLSYPSAHKETAESLCYELQAEGHHVFFDKEDLPAGQSFNERIRSSIEESDLFIFMITPVSVTKGKYTLTELKLASRKWPNPAGCVLPVMLEPTPFENVPAYLKAVTVLTPEGNVTAEILMEVADLAAARTPEPKEADAEKRGLESYSYHPVEIRFGKGGSGTYPVSLTESPAGSLAPEPCALDPDSLESRLWSSGGRVEGTVRRARLELGETNESLLPSAEDARRVGEKLYESLFTSHIQACLDGSLRTVDPQRRKGLRFLINTTEAPELARLPWEFLYSPDQDDFLFSDQMKPVIRWLDVDQPPPTLAVDPPLRLLMAIASPQDRPDLSVGEEITHLDDALSDLVEEGRVEVMRLEHTTLERLDDALLRNKPHVLHFIGHGDFVDDDGVVVLETKTPSRGSDPITGRRLGVLLRNYLGSLRFVFLNSCLGAAVSLRDPFGGVAQSLIRRGIPAVIAMQFPIPDRVAVSLARHFYRYLAAGLPVDAALTSARAFLFARGYEVEWGAPALHMRTPDGRLFEVSGQPPPADVAPSPEPASTVTFRKEENLRSALPEVAKREPAATRTRTGWWKWLVLALVVGLSAIAALWWLRPQETEKTEPPPDPVITIPREIEPPPDPVITTPREVEPLPDPIVTTPPASVEAEAHYREAVEALNKANIPIALGLIEQAQRKDPDGSVLINNPEVSTALFDRLLGAASEQLPDGDLDLARRIAGGLLSIRPDDLQAQTLLEVVDKLELYNHALKALRDGNTAIALNKLDEARRADPDGSLLADFPEVRAGLFDGFVDAADELLAYGDIELLTKVLMSLDSDRAAQEIERLVEPAAAGSAATYQVLSGDTLWDIAASIYGDPTLWPRLYNANRDRIQDPGLIYPNQELVAPSVERTESPTNVYRVEAGDSLWKIAASVYGDPRLWPLIYDANRGRIRDPDLIFPNQQLVIPIGLIKEQREQKLRELWDELD